MILIKIGVIRLRIKNLNYLGCLGLIDPLHFDAGFLKKGKDGVLGLLPRLPLVFNLPFNLRNDILQELEYFLEGQKTE